MGDLQGDHTTENQHDTQISGQSAGVIKKGDPDKKRSRCTDSSPHGICCSDRDTVLSQPKEEPADSHEDNRHEDSRYPHLWLLSKLEPDWPTYFKQSRNEKVDPSHSSISKANTGSNTIDYSDSVATALLALARLVLNCVHEVAHQLCRMMDERAVYENWWKDQPAKRYPDKDHPILREVGNSDLELHIATCPIRADSDRSGLGE